MERVTAKEIAEWTGGEMVCGSPETTITGVSTDTRTLKPGDLFFALTGENSDGHRFVVQALSSGAAGVVVSRDVEAPESASVIKVPNVLVALGDVAAQYRKRFDYRTVAITGSVGKTTVKEMVAQVLAKRWNVLKNVGNYNNEIGLPQTLFGLTHEHQVAVLEMGMRGPGEIRRLCEIAGPEVGIVTNIGITHIERLGSRDNIAAAKAELLEELPDSGYAILNADDDYYEFLKSKFNGKKLNYGYSENAEVRATNIRVDSSGRPAFSVVTPLGNFDVRLDVIGEHNVINALAAVTAGIFFEVPPGDIASALAGYVPPEKRANVVTTKSGITVLDDTYNASPASVTSALKTLQVMDGARKIAVLGDMLELGDHAISAHAEVGRTAAECGVDRLVTVGPLSKSIMDGAVSAGMKQDLVDSFDTSEQAGARIKSELRAGDVVLVKGSRGMKMEKIVEVLIGD